MQPIHAEARVCQHCRNPQSWWANSRDPRFMLVSFLFVMVLIIPLMLFWIPRTLPKDGPAEPPTLVVSDVSTRLTTASDGTRIFVLGVARNTSSTDATRIWFRVTMREDRGKLVDTLLLEDRGLLVPAGKSVPFRVSGLLGMGSLEGVKTEVVVERASAPSRWD
jgi:hypothetical protein